MPFSLYLTITFLIANNMKATEILDAILTNWVSVEQMNRIKADQDIEMYLNNPEVVKGERVPNKSSLLVSGEKLHGMNGEIEPDMIINADEVDVYFLYAID